MCSFTIPQGKKENEKMREKPQKSPSLFTSESSPLKEENKGDIVKSLTSVILCASVELHHIAVKSELVPFHR